MSYPQMKSPVDPHKHWLRGRLACVKTFRTKKVSPNQKKLLAIFQRPAYLQTMTTQAAQTNNATSAIFAREVLSSYGNGLAFGLSGTREQIERSFNRFFNLGIAGANVTSNIDDEGGWVSNGQTLGDGFLHYIGDSFAYFLTTENDIIRGLTWENVRLWQDSPISRQYKKNSAKFMRDAEAVARDTFANIPHENFMGWSTDRVPEGHQIREGSADWDPEN